jgi:hypothetical protein
MECYDVVQKKENEESGIVSATKETKNLKAKMLKPNA